MCVCISYVVFFKFFISYPRHEAQPVALDASPIAIDRTRRGGHRPSVLEPTLHPHMSIIAVAVAKVV